MWPWRRRGIEFEGRDGKVVHVADLFEAREDNSTTRYLNLVIMEMICKGTSEITFSEEEGFPNLSGSDDYPMPAYANVVNRLKVMSQLNAEMFREPKVGVVEMTARIPEPEFLTRTKTPCSGPPPKRMGYFKSWLWRFGIVSSHSMRNRPPSPAEQAELEAYAKQRDEEQEKWDRYLREHPPHDFKIHTQFVDRPTRSVTMRIEDLGPRPQW